MDQPLQIYGDPLSGNCLKVKWTADLLGVPYTWHGVSVVDGQTHQAEFLQINPFGQVPAVVLPSGESLAQSNAIMFYLNGAHGGALLPESWVDQSRVFEWLFWEQYSHEPAIAVRRFQKFYLGKDEDEIDPELLVNGNKVLQHLDATLEGKPYLVAERLSLADIALVAYSRVAPQGGFDLAPFSNLRAWIARIERDLGIELKEMA